jgi:hypothetical protein
MAAERAAAVRSPGKKLVVASSAEFVLDKTPLVCPQQCGPTGLILRLVLKVAQVVQRASRGRRDVSPSGFENIVGEFMK